MRAILLLFLLLSPSGALAGPLADAVERGDDGHYYFQFATKPGVYGDGHSLTIDHDGSGWHRPMDEGPGRVWLRIRDGEVVDVDLEVGGRAPRLRGSTTDLGTIEPEEVRTVMLALAASTRERDLESTIVCATITEGFDDWQPLLEIARDEGRPDDLRESAIFWLGQGAGDVATEGLTALVEDDDVELELREHAIFSLSQQGIDRAFGPLSNVALHSKHPQLREQAFFWLAQHDDPRVIDLLEDVLLR